MASRKKRMPSSKRPASVLRLKKFASLNRKKIKGLYHSSIIFIEKRPFVSFFAALGILLIVILLGSTIFRISTPEVEEKSEPKRVKVFNIGEEAHISVQGQVKKAGVIKIVAQSPGIVAVIHSEEGNKVAKGQTIISLSSNYQGGNAPSLQRQLASVQYQNVKQTYDLQKDLIARQKDLANTRSENADELRDITQVSINDTRDLLSLNNNILNQIKANIQTLQNNNGDPQQILSLQQLQSQIQGGTNQLSASLRANELQVDKEGTIVEIENLNKEIALKQLEIQEKALKLSLQAASIQLQLARVQEATMFPAAPFTGTIQKIHVKVGQAVNPGEVLVTFSGGSDEVMVDAQVTKEISEKVSRIEPSVIEISGKKFELLPDYISTEATSGQLYSILFTIDKSHEDLFTDASFVSVSLPLGYKIGTPASFIPVDSVFQTQDEVFIFVVEGGRAKSKKIRLGEVTGGYVTVLDGLNLSDKVILNRTVIEGDEVVIEN